MELDYSRIFQNFEDHLLKDERPSKYFSEEIDKKYFSQYPLDMLKNLRDIPQSPKYHPEGNVWNHTMEVVDEAANRKNESEDKRVFMWAALLHDIGKVPATRVKKGRIIAYDHDRIGAALSVEFLENFTDEKEFIYRVSSLVRWHMQILFVVKDLPFANVEKMMEETSYKEIALLGLCDRLGRGELSHEEIKEEERAISKFIEKCESKYVEN